MQVNKTDRNDAFGLAQIMRTGWYREVGVKRLENHKVRAVLGARAQLVGMRTDIRNQIRGLLKVFGVVLERNSGISFEERWLRSNFVARERQEADHRPHHAEHLGNVG